MRLTQIQSTIASQLTSIANLSRAIEGYSGVPTADQHRHVGSAFDEVAKIVSELSRLLRADTPTPPQPISVPPKTVLTFPLTHASRNLQTEYQVVSGLSRTRGDGPPKGGHYSRLKTL